MNASMMIQQISSGLFTTSNITKYFDWSTCGIPGRMDWRKTSSETGSTEVPANRIYSADYLCIDPYTVK